MHLAPPPGGGQEDGMARSIWKGSITFGLVNIPVALYAAEQREDIPLHLLDKRNMARVRYKRVNEESGREVPWEDTVRGFEVEGGVDSWQPEKYKDTYYRDLMKTIKERAAAGQFEKAPEPAEKEERKRPSNVVDLMALLKQSVEQGGKAPAKSARKAPAKKAK